MPLKLILLRHAKAEPVAPGQSDAARPLSARGRGQVKRLNRYLSTTPQHTDVIACSIARRTRQTLAAITPSLPGASARFLETLYLAPRQDLLDFVLRGGHGARTLMIIGHNPGLQDLALTLIGKTSRGEKRSMARLRAKFGTCAWCEIEFPGPSWRSIAPGAGTLVRFLRPGDIKPGESGPRR